MRFFNDVYGVVCHNRANMFIRHRRLSSGENRHLEYMDFCRADTLSQYAIRRYYCGITFKQWQLSMLLDYQQHDLKVKALCMRG